MGQFANSDEWYQNSDYIVNGLNFCKKNVNDILIWAKNETELINNCQTAPNRCRDLNISILEKKLKISNSISFAGPVVPTQVLNLISILPEQLKTFLPQLTFQNCAR